MRNSRPWSPGDIDMLHRDYPDTPARDLSERLGRSVKSIYSMANKLGIRKSDDYLASPKSGRLQPGHTKEAGRFRKGHRPHNAGKKGWQAGGRSAETRFRKGQVNGKAARLLKPLGYERVTDDGIRQRKIRMDGPLHRRWRSVHSILWEEHHGPIPKGHVVVFRNGDRSDIRIDNLELVTRAELMARNTIQRYPKELRSTMHLAGKLRRKIREKQD